MDIVSFWLADGLILAVEDWICNITCLAFQVIVPKQVILTTVWVRIVVPCKGLAVQSEALKHTNYPITKHFQILNTI